MSVNMETNEIRMGNPLKITYATSGIRTMAKHIHCVAFHFFFRSSRAFLSFSSAAISSAFVFVIIIYFLTILVSIALVAFAAD